MKNDELKRFHETIYSPAVVNVLSKSQDTRLDKWPPTWAAASHRMNSNEGNSTIPFPIYFHEIQDFITCMRLFSTGCAEFVDWFLFCCARNVKQYCSASDPELMLEMLEAPDHPLHGLDWNMLFTRTRQEDSSWDAYIDIGLEFSPPRGLDAPPVMGLWRFDELNQLLGCLVGGSHAAGGSWSYTDLYAHLGRTGGIHGPPSQWAKENLGILRMVFYMSNKFLFVSQARPDKDLLVMSRGPFGKTSADVQPRSQPRIFQMAVSKRNGTCCRATSRIIGIQVSVCGRNSGLNLGPPKHALDSSQSVHTCSSNSGPLRLL